MMIVQEISSGDWPALAARFADFSFEQSQTYGGAAAARIGGQLQFVAIEDGQGQLVAAASVRIKRLPGLGRGIAWIASGPMMVPLSGQSPEPARQRAVLEALRAHYTGARGHILRFRLPGVGFQDADQLDKDAQAAGFAPSLRASAYRSAVIDLTADDATLMKGFNGKWRTDLRYALKSDLTLEAGQDLEMRARFMALFTVVQQAKGFAPDITPAFHFALEGSDYAWEVLIASKDGADLAGIIVGWSGATAVYLFGATADAGRKVRAGYFLTWEGLRRARVRGQAWYDMGGIDDAANPSVARFKHRMNGRAVQAFPYEARPAGLGGALIGGLEALRARLKGRA